MVGKRGSNNVIVWLGIVTTYISGLVVLELSSASKVHTGGHYIRVCVDTSVEH